MTGVLHVMMRAARCRRLLVWGVMLLTVVAGAARAQAQVKGEIVSVGIGGVNGNGGVYREGSWIPVQVRLQNTSGKAFVGHLAIDQELVDLDGDKLLSVGPEFTLSPGIDQRTLWTYYWPRPDFTNANMGLAKRRGISKVIVLDKNQATVGVLSTPQELDTANAVGPEDDNGERRSMRNVLIIGRNAGGWKSLENVFGGAEGIKTITVNNANQLPDRALGYDGVDVIFWQTQGVKLSDMSPPEFTLGPILEWVRSGGHLIISVSAPDQVQAFSHGDEAARGLLPMELAGTRDIKTTDLTGMYGWGGTLGGNPAANLVQAVGKLKPGARAVVGDAASFKADGRVVFSENPIAATQLYGQGAVTLVTIDPCDQEMLQRQDEKGWIYFWYKVAGWRENSFGGNFITAAEFQKKTQQQRENDYHYAASAITLGSEIDKNVDVSDVTAVRILVALLFLGIYWLVAGPLGHLILRAYKVVHWSWWVFGGTVILATGVAGVVVLLLHVTNYEVRHESFVMGTVTPDGQTDGESTVTGFYGVYAPSSGLTPVAEPNGQGLSYLAPLCLPTTKEVKAFADPQSYTLQADHPTTVSPVFRNTLKKLQGRWHGQLPGVTGSAAYAAVPVAVPTSNFHVVDGALTNRSGYELKDVVVALNLPQVSRAMDQDARYAENDGTVYLLRLRGGDWASGRTVDLAKDFELDEMGRISKDPLSHIGTLEMGLEAAGWKLATSEKTGPYGYNVGFNELPSDASDQLKALAARQNWNWDLMYMLGDLRNNDDLAADNRRDLARGVGRMTDVTKALRAAGAMIVAHAEDVKSPIALSVNGHTVAGKGMVTFAWALPVGGTAPEKRMDKLTLPAPATGSRPAGRNAGANPLIPDEVKPEGP